MATKIDLNIPKKVNSDYFNLEDFKNDFNVISDKILTEEKRTELNENRILTNEDNIRTLEAKEVEISDKIKVLPFIETDIQNLQNEDIIINSELARIEAKIPEIGGDGQVDLSKYLDKTKDEIIPGSLTIETKLNANTLESSNGTINTLASDSISTSFISSESILKNGEEVLTATTKIDDLSNINVNPTQNDVLVFNGSNWVNSNALNIGKATVTSVSLKSAKTTESAEIFWNANDTNDFGITFKHGADAMLGIGYVLGSEKVIRFNKNVIPAASSSLNIGASGNNLNAVYSDNFYLPHCRIMSVAADGSGNGVKFLKLDNSGYRDITCKTIHSIGYYMSDENVRALSEVVENAELVNNTEDKALNLSEAVQKSLEAIIALNAEIKELKEKISKLEG